MKAEVESKGNRTIRTFGCVPGDILADKFEVIDRLGRGWEGEVYLVRERATGIERSAKLFFPQRNLGNRTVRFYAKKLHRLRHCPILIQYLSQETVRFGETRVTLLVSDYVEGELLSTFLKRQSGRRLDHFQGLHLLHELAAGIERIHNLREYHGDLHDENVIVRRRGIGFEVKLVDMYHWGPPSAANIRQDVADLIRIFYDVLGGQRWYSRQPPEVKAVCCGLKTSLMARKFRTAGQLRQYLETMTWESR
ncbi:MAG: protein kinase [bacterium]